MQGNRSEGPRTWRGQPKTEVNSSGNIWSETDTNGNTFKNFLEVLCCILEWRKLIYRTELRRLIMTRRNITKPKHSPAWVLQIKSLQLYPYAFCTLNTNLSGPIWRLIFIKINQIYLTAIIDPPFWIFHIWMKICNQRLQKPLSNNFQGNLINFRDLRNVFLFLLQPWHKLTPTLSLF